uniref:DUF577 domain-containing protein n=1 Tax=Steinernema glaseri TaxID=37863 RepID=A0A1I7Y7L8_9BILA
MVDRVIGESLTYKLRVLKQIWTVLLRSRHKGVVDDCATQFERLRLKCSDKEVRGILEETLTLFGDENCSSRNLAFWRILLCFPKDVDTLIEKFIFHLNSKSDTVVIRSLKALKAVLGNSKYSADCEKFYSRILDFILQEYSKTSWAVRSAMNHTFEVLVHALFSRIPNNVPIFNFVFDYHQVWRVVVKALQSVRSDMDPQVVLVLSILERVLFVDELFFYDQELDTITIIREDLQRLRRSSKQIRIAQLLMDCHMNFTALSGWYEVGDKLKEMLSTCVTEGCGTSKAINHFCAVHAVRKISTEVRLPFSLPVDHYFEEQRKLGEHHPLNNLEIKDVAVFESLAVSAKELNRLCASFSLPYQWSLHPTSLSRRRNILPQAPRGGT